MEFKEIEKKWQKKWSEMPDLYRAKDFEGNKFYVLNEFPYPSGSGLHVGHAFSYTAGDIYARFKRMQGFNVLFPMGYDAFGLPTENYAIKMKQKPQEVTKENTANFRETMDRLALSFDWCREVNTTDADYYKWTQWIFIKLFEKGLAHKEEMPINWCPSCKIGLANEEVVNGKCERCGTEVSRRNISQWVVKITDYADRLIDGLKDTHFIERVKQVQINWIGKSEGARINFQLSVTSDQLKTKSLEVFTTRPDTLYGATFMVISPEHELAIELGKANEEIKKYQEEARKKSDMERTELAKEKTGVFSGLYAINPVTNKEIPIWISDFVLASYGTGAIMSVPAHDERDFEFAQKYNLPIIPVIKQKHEVSRSYLMGAKQISDNDLKNLGIKIVGKSDSGSRKLEIPVDKLNEYEKLITEKLDNGFWNEYIGDEVVFIFKNKQGEIRKIVLNMETEQEIDKLAAEYNGENWTQKQSVWAWLADCDWYKDYIFTTDVDNGLMINSPLWNGIKPSEAIKKAILYIKEKGIGEGTNNYHLRDWIFSRQHYWGEPIPMVNCSVCGWVPEKEENLPIVLPEVEAYEPTDDGQSPLSKIDAFVNCMCPKCGGAANRETDTMPNWAGSDWYFLRYMDPHNNSRLVDFDLLKYWGPVDVYIGGDEHNTLHLLYSRFIYLFLYDLGIFPKELPEPYDMRVSHGVILGPDNQRMSKSHGNVIVPGEVADKYGVDVLRMYLMFMGPFDGTMAWNEKTLMGVKRFLDRFEKAIISYQLRVTSVGSEEAKVIINKTIAGVTKDINEFGYNTAIAKMMECMNKLSVNSYELSTEDIKKLIKLMAPMAPYLAEELWNRLHQGSGEPQSIHSQKWPEAEDKYLIEDEVTVMVAVNGKVKSQLRVKSYELTVEKDIVEMAKSIDKIKELLVGKEIVKEIYVPGKMVNFVIK